MTDDITMTEVDIWATRIRPHLEAAAENIVTAGRKLIDAKEALDHGDFLDLVKYLDLRPRTAQKFMSIARNQLIANAPPGTHLPASWTTLYELSRAPAEVLEQALADGEVTPDMSRKDALQLVARLQTQTAEAEARELTARVRRAQWEMGGFTAACLREGMDITNAEQMVDDFEPEIWEAFGYDGPVAWLEDCAVIFKSFPAPDFSLPWDEQQVAS